MEKPFLITLNALLGDRGQDKIYLCIRDLVENGLDLTRFSAGELRPQRQDLTQYLAAWSRHAGLSEEESRGWLMDYCVLMLASISSRSPAAIRHSTKSNLRYIYRSAVPFLCQCDNNPFRARCSPDCPVYADMQAQLRAKAIEALNPKPYVRPPLPVPVPKPVRVPVLPVKKVYQEQFATGMRLALEEVKKGAKLGSIVDFLNAHGLKTRTGRKWQNEILRNELQRLKRAHASSPSGPEGADGPGCPDP